MSGLFPDDPPRPLVARARSRRPKVDRAHAARPGTGPAGETCRSCRHYVRLLQNVRVYRKCGLLEKTWTHGPGTDIRARDAACARWEPPAVSP